LLADAGVSTPPRTWDQLTEMAAKTSKSSALYGIAFSAVNTEEATWQWEPFLWSNGGSLTDLDSRNAQVALQLWIDWVKNGYASRDVVNWNQGDVPTSSTAGGQPRWLWAHGNSQTLRKVASITVL
jgi:multiple sugar transport system substrate-binding protein